MRIAPSVLFCCVPALAQIIQLQVQTPSNGNNADVVVELMMPAGKDPVALQWDFSFPVTVQLDATRTKVADSAAKAHKSVRCEILPNRQGKTQTGRCIVAGGTEPIPSGPVASVHFGFARTSHYQLQLKKAIAVSSDLKKMSLKDTQVEITVSK